MGGFRGIRLFMRFERALIEGHLVKVMLEKRELACLQ